MARSGLYADWPGTEKKCQLYLAISVVCVSAFVTLSTVEQRAKFQWVNICLDCKLWTRITGGQWVTRRFTQAKRPLAVAAVNSSAEVAVKLNAMPLPAWADWLTSTRLAGWLSRMRWKRERERERERTRSHQARRKESIKPHTKQLHMGMLSTVRNDATAAVVSLKQCLGTSWNSEEVDSLGNVQLGEDEWMNWRSKHTPSMWMGSVSDTKSTRKCHQPSLSLSLCLIQWVVALLSLSLSLSLSL